MRPFMTGTHVSTEEFSHMKMTTKGTRYRYVLSSFKTRGIFAGHDYMYENAGEWRMDEKGNVIKEKKAVKAAVDEFAKKNNLHVITSNEEVINHGKNKI